MYTFFFIILFRFVKRDSIFGESEEDGGETSVGSKSDTLDNTYGEEIFVEEKHQLTFNQLRIDSTSQTALDSRSLSDVCNICLAKLDNINSDSDGIKNCSNPHTPLDQELIRPILLKQTHVMSTDLMDQMLQGESKRDSRSDSGLMMTDSNAHPSEDENSDKEEVYEPLLPVNDAVPSVNFSGLNSNTVKQEGNVDLRKLVADIGKIDSNQMNNDVLSDDIVNDEPVEIKESDLVPTLEPELHDLVDILQTAIVEDNVEKMNCRKSSRPVSEISHSSSRNSQKYPPILPENISNAPSRQSSRADMSRSSSRKSLVSLPDIVSRQSSFVNGGSRPLSAESLSRNSSLKSISISESIKSLVNAQPIVALSEQEVSRPISKISNHSTNFVDGEPNEASDENTKLSAVFHVFDSNNDGLFPIGSLGTMIRALGWLLK